MKFDFSINIPIVIMLVVAFAKFYSDVNELKLKTNAMWAVFMRTFGTRVSPKNDSSGEFLGK